MPLYRDWKGYVGGKLGVPQNVFPNSILTIHLKPYITHSDIPY